MHDEKRLNFIIEDIEIYLEKLNKLKIDPENLKDDEKFLASSMAIFQIINRSIDLGDEIVKSDKLGYPMKIKDIFEFLENEKILDKDLSNKMKDLVMVRNRFSHHYEKINEEDIFDFLKEDQKYVLEFIERIKNYLRDKNNN